MKAAKHRRALTMASVATLTILASCGEGDYSTMRIRASSSLTDATGIEGIRIRLNDREFTSEDFAASGNPLEVSLRVPNQGELLIEMQLIQGGEVVAEGSFALEMTPNFEWNAFVRRLAEDPTAGCLGCLGKESFAVLPAFAKEPGEALWFYWGGKERGSNVVF